MFRAKITARFDFPEVDFSPSLMVVAKKIVIPLIKEGILTNTDIYGKRFPKLAASTIRSKGHDRPLQEESILIKSFKYKSDGKDVVVYISGSRDEVARYLQIEGVGKSRKKFEFFGVTDGMEKEATAFIKKEIVKWVKRANRG